jgi:nucleoside phosphorylase
MNILILDDNSEKVQEVVSVLIQNPNINPEWITSCAYAVQAREYMAKQSYDLLILDICIPNRNSDQPDPNLGIGLVEELISTASLKRPRHIIGLTAYSDLLSTHQVSRHVSLWSVLHYDPTIDWRTALAQKVEYCGKQRFDEDELIRANYDYDLAIVTALVNPELDAVRSLLNREVRLQSQKDPSIYYSGFFEDNGKSKRVVAASSSQMGMQASNVLAMKMIATFRPRNLAMCGITAGIYGKAAIGDVIACDMSYDYGSGKYKIKDGSSVFEPDPRPLNVDVPALNRLKEIESTREYLDEICNDWKGTKVSARLNLAVGPLLSGAAVVQDPNLVKRVQGNQRKVVGIDMETYGLFYAAHHCASPQPRVFSFKSVSDYADEAKDDSSQKYASYTSAAFLKKFVVHDL